MHSENSQFLISRNEMQVGNTSVDYQHEINLSLSGGQICSEA